MRGFLITSYVLALLVGAALVLSATAKAERPVAPGPPVIGKFFAVDDPWGSNEIEYLGAIIGKRYHPERVTVTIGDRTKEAERSSYRKRAWAVAINPHSSKRCFTFTVTAENAYGSTSKTRRVCESA